MLRLIAVFGRDMPMPNTCIVGEPVILLSAKLEPWSSRTAVRPPANGSNVAAAWKRTVPDHIGRPDGDQPHTFRRKDSSVVS